MSPSDCHRLPSPRALLALGLLLWSGLGAATAVAAPADDPPDGGAGTTTVGSGGFVGAGEPAPESKPDPDAEGPEGVSVAYGWPTGGPVAVLAPFEGSATPYGPGHRGVDLAVLPGDAVLAAADGEVAFAGSVAGRGVVSIDHADGLRTTYEPLVPNVAAGDPVVAGQPIGVLDVGHCAPPGCLHWGARRGSHDYVDPLSLLDDAPRPVRLLPLGNRLPLGAPTFVSPATLPARAE